MLSNFLGQHFINFSFSNIKQRKYPSKKFIDKYQDKKVIRNQSYHKKEIDNNIIEFNVYKKKSIKIQEIIKQQELPTMANPFSDAAFQPNPQHSTQNRYVPVSLLNIISNNKLPKIDKNRQVDDQAKRLNYRSSVKSSTKLPHLKADNLNAQISSKIKQTIISNSHGLISSGSKRQKSQGDDFLTQIQKKLKLVLQSQNNDNYGEPSESDEDFQRKVNKNKQKIKKQRLRRQAQNQSLIQQPSQNFSNSNNNTNNIVMVHQTLQNKNKESNKSHQDLHKIVANMNKNKQRIDVMYEKRVKDYKEQSIGNKILMKKKQLAQRQLSKKSPQIQGQQAVQIINYKSAKNRSIKNNSSRNTKKQGSQHVSLTEKDQDLFDKIHNILLNLNRKSENDMIKQRSKQKMKQKEKQKPKKTKQQMEDQIRVLELKLAGQRRQDLLLLSKLEINRKNQKNKYQLQTTQATINTHNLEENAMNWRKVETSGTNLQVKRSNFEEQIQRINKYFEKNQRSLDKYVQNQRKIANLNHIRRRNQVQSQKINT